MNKHFYLLLTVTTIAFGVVEATAEGNSSQLNSQPSHPSGLQGGNISNGQTLPLEASTGAPVNSTSQVAQGGTTLAGSGNIAEPQAHESNIAQQGTTSMGQNQTAETQQEATANAAATIRNQGTEQASLQPNYAGSSQQQLSPANTANNTANVAQGQPLQTTSQEQNNGGTQALNTTGTGNVNMLSDISINGQIKFGKGYKNNTIVEESTNFSPNTKITAHAQINTAHPTKVTFIWKRDGKEVVRNTSKVSPQNLNAWCSRSFKTPAQYTVTILSDKGQEIGSSSFSISQNSNNNHADQMTNPNQNLGQTQSKLNQGETSNNPGFTDNSGTRTSGAETGGTSQGTQAQVATGGQNSFGQQVQYQEGAQFSGPYNQLGNSQEGTSAQAYNQSGSQAGYQGTQGFVQQGASTATTQAGDDTYGQQTDRLDNAQENSTPQGEGSEAGNYNGSEGNNAETSNLRDESRELQQF